MEYQVANAFLSIRVKDKGAELCSFFDRSRETELLWQADPDVWGRHAPNLFPMVGQVKGGAYQVNGAFYSMGRHGFARDKVFGLAEQSDQHLVFSLEESEDTLKQYPFRFQFRVSYFLMGQHLKVTYSVKNPADAPMWFSAGAHPAFRVPVLEHESYHDYDLVFEKRETKETHRLVDGLFDGTREPILEDQDVLPLTHHLFAKDALVFHQLTSSWVALKSRTSGRGVKLHSPGWPYYGIWAKTNGDFVCLEPWYGRADDSSSTGIWQEKPGIIRLDSGNTWTASYEIEALEEES